MKYCLLLILLGSLFTFSARSQKDTTGNWKLYPSAEQSDTTSVTDSLAYDSTTKAGTVEIIQDVRIKKLLDKEIQINDSTGTIRGFRVQLFSSSGVNSKSKALKVESEFLKKHPEVPAYLVFKSPNFKVRVGNFRTKLEAVQFHREIAPDFPNSFIVKDEIKLPELK